MGRVSGDRERMVAVLHDVVEDTEATTDDLALAGCPSDVLQAVDAISRRPGEDHEAYLARVAANDLALVVKRADIADNCSPDRMARLDEATRERLQVKYAHALRLLDEYVARAG
jgi:hypothetical protein